MDETNNKWLVVVNSHASIGKCGKDWPLINDILIKEGFEFDAVMTERIGHAIEIVRNGIQEKGYKKIISVGGDGTNNEVINGIFTQNRYPTNEITMGIIPIGTGNDWGRSFGFPIDYQETINILKQGHIFHHDIGKVAYYNDGNPKERFFLNAAGTGLDEMVCNKTNRLKSQGKGGTIRYLISTAYSIIAYKCQHVQIEVDGTMIFDDKIMSLSIGNGKYNGGGMKMMPEAVPDDGLFDITAIKKLGLLKFAANMKNIYDGSFAYKLKEVSLYKGRKIKVVSIPSHKLLLETEGETLTNSPFYFDILPKAINMVVPKASDSRHCEEERRSNPT